MSYIKCSCDNQWMDKKYGNNVRVGNKTSKTTPQEYRCVVCGKETSRGAESTSQL